MSNKPFEEAVERVERALLRIERAVERGTPREASGGAERDEQLRVKVAAALGEIDQIIREAEGEAPNPLPTRS